MKIDDKYLDSIHGGALTSAMLNAITSMIKALFSAGEAVGASFKRINDGTVCR